MKVVIEGLEEIRRRFARFPDKYHAVMRTTMSAVLLKVWENVPEYPRPPANSTYIRTGQLGRSLGSNEAGGKSGSVEPSIYEVKRGASGMWEASFGTNLEYAQYVIGERQSAHMTHWWTMHKTLLNKVKDPIIKLFQIARDEMVRWLNNQ